MVGLFIFKENAMILGRSTAQTEKEIITEYHQFLQDNCQEKTPKIIKRLLGVPQVMRKRIGKSLLDWTDEEIIQLYVSRGKATGYTYTAFLAFLFFRGYRQATLHLLTTLPMALCRQHRQVLLPYRQRLEQTQQELKYSSAPVGAELNLLIWLLAIVGKPLEELTRTDFDTFRTQYQAWFRQTGQRKRNLPNPHLSRLEYYLIHWEVIPPAKIIFKHEEHFAKLRHKPIQEAILVHMQWCDAKYKPSSIHSRRAALINFFLWFQECHPDCAKPDDVTRYVALDYAQYLKSKVDDGTYSPKYRSDLYRHMRLFYNFLIDECLETSPDRNPFGAKDTPKDPNPVPRFISDRELRQVLDYCNNGASPKERTIVITLLHTGIRAAELASLCVSDIVEIQGKWKLHIREGKGLKDRVIPLTPECLASLHAWQEDGWEAINDHLFTRFGRPWKGGHNITTVIRELSAKLMIKGLTPHRFRHTYAVALLNYGIRESALQKLMGHSTLNMTLEYGRILDQTVEQSFNKAIEQMQTGPLSWVPNFFSSEEFTLFAEEDAVNWIRLPHGYCRRNLKLHCESDIKCLLCDRFCADPGDLARLREMHQRYLTLEMKVKADVVLAQIRYLESHSPQENLPIPVMHCEDTNTFTRIIG